MAAPTGTPQQNEKLADDLTALEEGLQDLQVRYEKYFLGLDRKAPELERKRIAARMRDLRLVQTRNTALKFRVQTVFAKLVSFERMWDRTLREIEEGTYKRDLFKAKLHQQPGKAPKAAPAAAPDISDGQLRKLFDTYMVARQRTGESTAGLTYDAVAKRIRSQLPELMEKHKARNIEFKVVIKGGKAVLKAVPHV